MKSFLFALSMCLSITCGNVVNAQELPKFGEMVKSYSILATIRGLREYSSSDDYIPTYSFQSYSTEQFNKIFSVQPTKLNSLSAETRLSLMQFYKDLGYIADVTAVKALMRPNLAQNSDGDTCIYVGSFSLDMSFNAIRTTELERAKSAIEKAVLPVVQKSITNLINIGHKYILIGVGYGVRDFSGSEGACVMCVFSVDDLKDFDSLELSEEELLHKTSIYIKDTGEMKKVSL